MHSVKQRTSISCILSYLELFAATLNRLYMEQASSVNWGKLCNQEGFLYRLCFEYIVVNKKRQFRGF